MAQFVPRDFDPPRRAELGAFLVTPLLISDIIPDYDAVMTSVERLTRVFGPNTDWPRGLTLEDDLVDLGWHHKEFNRRTSFAYKVHLGEVYAGCLYLNPSPAPAYDAIAHCWVRDSHVEHDGQLYDAFAGWLKAAWPFRAVTFPGRTIGWDAWRAEIAA